MTKSGRIISMTRTKLNKNGKILCFPLYAIIYNLMQRPLHFSIFSLLNPKFSLPLFPSPERGPATLLQCTASPAVGGGGANQRPRAASRQRPLARSSSAADSAGGSFLRFSSSAKVLLEIYFGTYVWETIGIFNVSCGITCSSEW